MENNDLPDIYSFPLPNGLHYPMVRVRPGIFIMGSEGKNAPGWEKPEHLVCLTRDYYIGVCPVTQAVWKTVMNGHNPARFVGDNRPVERVSWIDIVEGGQDEEVPESFLNRINGLCPAPEPSLAKYRFQLPTEAEWEYAAKGGHRTALSKEEIRNPPKAEHRYPPYAGGYKLKGLGWYNLNSHSETKPVGLKLPNELGLYDMSGNVYEWCGDWYHMKYYKSCFDRGIVENPTGPRNGSARVDRGGGWSDEPSRCRFECRNGWHPSNRRSNLGFRLVFVP